MAQRRIAVLFSQQRVRASTEVTAALYVTMEILSNWGSSSQVGLTEVQFFCRRNGKLYVSPHDLDIRNADHPGNLGALVNGKAKVSLFNPLRGSLKFSSSGCMEIRLFQDPVWLDSVQCL